jgi:hypothetical protein
LVERFFSKQSYKTGNGMYFHSDDYDCADDAYWIAPHNGRCYDADNDYPRCADGSPDMRYAENYTHADDD